MTSKKTTVVGVIGGLGLILTQVWFAMDGDPSTVLDYSQVVAGFGMLGIGWFARDNDTSSESAGAK